MAESIDSSEEKKKSEGDSSQQQASERLSDEAYEPIRDHQSARSDEHSKEPVEQNGSAKRADSLKGFERDPAADRKSLIENGFPDLTLTNEIDDKSPLPVGKTDGPRTEASAESHKDTDFLVDNDNLVDELPAEPFGDGRSAVLIADDHEGSNEVRLAHFEAVVKELKDKGLSHVALEFVPGSKEMNEKIKEYKEAKEALEKAKRDGEGPDRIKELERDVERRKQELRDRIAQHMPKNDQGKPQVGKVTPDDVIDMIDAAHRNNVDVFGLEPPGQPALNGVMEELRDDETSEGDEGREAFLEFFRGDATADEHEQAEKDLTEYFKSKGYSAEEIERRLHALRQAREQGFSLQGDEGFPERGEALGETFETAFMNYRDGYFAGRINEVTGNGGRVLAFAGEMHFSQLSDASRSRLSLNDDDLFDWMSTSELLTGRHLVIRSKPR